MEPEPVEDERPLTREHLESRVMRTLPKKLETHIKIRPIGHETQGKRSPARR